MKCITPRMSRQPEAACTGFLGTGARRLLLAVIAAGTLAACSLLAVEAVGATGSGRVISPASPSQSGMFSDRYEPNDTYQQNKIIIDVSPVISLTFCAWDACSPDDTDWYAFYVNPSSVLTMAAQSAGFIVLQAHAFLTDGVTPAGTFVDVVGSSTLVVTNTAPAIQKYLARVTNGSGQNAVYALTYTSAAIPVPTPTGPAPDAYEPNDTLAEANVPTGTRAPGASIRSPRWTSSRASRRRCSSINLWPTQTTRIWCWSPRCLVPATRTTAINLDSAAHRSRSRRLTV